MTGLAYKGSGISLEVLGTDTSISIIYGANSQNDGGSNSTSYEQLNADNLDLVRVRDNVIDTINK